MMTPLVSHSLLSLAAELPEPPSFAENSLYQVTGLLVVFAALGFLTLAIKLVGILFGAVPASKSAPANSPDSHASDSEMVPGSVVAAISAAVHIVLNEPFRITSIKPLPSPSGSTEWSKEGRRQIFSSHRVR